MCSTSCELGVQPAAGVVEVDVAAAVQAREVGAAKLVEHGRVVVARMVASKRIFRRSKRLRLGMGDAHVAHPPLVNRHCRVPPWCPVERGGPSAAPTRLRLRRFAPRRAEYERESERPRSRGEPPNLLNRESGGRDRADRVASEMASRAEMWPDARAIEACLNGFAKAPFGDDVLVEAELSAGHEDSVQLGERYLLVDHRAQDERADDGIEDAVLVGQQLGCAIDDLDRHGRGASGIAGKPTEIRLGLNREDLRHIGWVVGEVAAIACPHLENPST